ncbi:MAG: RNA methyltransferase [Rhizobiales bacterium]|nr:RNA methyltransferase [Hyphomicrobiales bacterium]
MTEPCPPAGTPAPEGRGDAPTTPDIILVRPQLGDNIGAAARAMANFGLERLSLVSPRDGWPNELARRAASGADSIVDGASLHADVAGAVGNLNYVVATTARPRDMAKPVLDLEEAALALRSRILAGQRVGVLFGPERTGLENDEVAIADSIVMAPVNPRFASINLAQTVLLIGYEWRKLVDGEGLGRHTTFDGIVGSGPRLRGSPPATRQELLGFFGHIEGELDKSGFFKPPEKRASMVRNLRSMFARMEPSEQEVRTLRGIVASLTGAHLRRRPTP